MRHIKGFRKIYNKKTAIISLNIGNRLEFMMKALCVLREVKPKVLKTVDLSHTFNSANIFSNYYSE
jgi:hypothetical protein